MHRRISVITSAPLTTQGRATSWRVPVNFDAKDDFILLDQIRAVSERRMLKNLGRLDAPTSGRVLAALTRMFAP